MFTDDNSISCFVDDNTVNCWVDDNGITLCCGEGTQVLWAQSCMSLVLFMLLIL